MTEMMSASRLGGFQGYCDQGKGHLGVSEGKADLFRIAPFEENPRAVCHFSENGIECVFWGELYGPMFPGSSATLIEKVVSGYRDYGADFGGRLDGVFALALWDERAGRLVLYRDSSASRSVYYHHDSRGRLHFSTSLARLVREGGFSIGKAGLQEYLRFLEVVPPHTLYDGIYALEAGYRLVFESGRVEVKPAPQLGDFLPDAANVEGAIDQLDELLQQAVLARMDDSGSIGAFLSGGIDSALICALARNVGRLPAGAVTVGFKEARFDESGLATDIAAYLGIPHRILRFGSMEYLNAFKQLYADSEQPSADPSGMSTLLAFEYCADKYCAMLDGSGAEALVGIMPARYTRIAVQYAARLPVAVRKLIASLLRPWPSIGSNARIFDFDDPEELLIRWRGFPRAELEKLFGEPVSFVDSSFYRVFRSYGYANHFERYTALLGVLSDDRIHNAAAITGLPVRFPFLDRRVESYVKVLPPAWRSTEAREKLILKAILERYLPVALWDVPKHGFDFPLQAFISANQSLLVDQYLDSAESPLLKVFDRTYIRTYAEKFRAGDMGVLFRVWALAALAKWLENR